MVESSNLRLVFLFLVGKSPVTINCLFACVSAGSKKHRRKILRKRHVFRFLDVGNSNLSSSWPREPFLRVLLGATVNSQSESSFQKSAYSGVSQCGKLESDVRFWTIFTQLAYTGDHSCPTSIGCVGFSAEKSLFWEPWFFQERKKKELKIVERVYFLNALTQVSGPETYCYHWFLDTSRSSVGHRYFYGPTHR